MIFATVHHLLLIALLLGRNHVTCATVGDTLGMESRTILPLDNKDELPILLRVARGEHSARTPVWMMRLAGRHMKAYRDLIEKYPTFRERSEIPRVSLEISLQPLEAYGVDGVILFSDNLTPLPAMGVDFSISEGGKISIEPIRTWNSFERLRRVYHCPDDSADEDYSYSKTCSFVGTVLRDLRKEVGNRATILGFVGLPFTLAMYLVEGQTGTASGFVNTRCLREDSPELLRSMLSLLAENVADYACYQIDCGAQVIQLFDSWAGHLDCDAYNAFCLPYQQRVVSKVKERHPNTPIIIYMAPTINTESPSKEDRRKRLEQLVASGADIVSLDHTIDLKEALMIIPEHVGLQGNLDPAVLRDGPKEKIKQETENILTQMAASSDGTKRVHIMNLGHGIDPKTPEDHASFFVKIVQKFQTK